jgi:hypothetical protein
MPASFTILQTGDRTISENRVYTSHGPAYTQLRAHCAVGEGRCPDINEVADLCMLGSAILSIGDQSFFAQSCLSYQSEQIF